MTTVARSTPEASSEAVLEESEQPSRIANWAGRLGVAGLVATAPAATVYLSFSNGGFFPNSVGIVAICFCAALVLRVTLADRPFEGYNRALALALVALSLFALLQLVSISWSHAPAPALDDYDRTLLYVLVLALFGSLPRSTLRIKWLVWTLALSMSVVCLIALTSRVLPHVWPTSADFYTSRLDYPLGYTNALGFMGVLACILLLHLASSLRESWPIRIAAAGLFPAVATAALLTYSRGGLAAGIVGLGVYAVLARPRGLLTALIAIGPTTFFAVRSAYDATLLSGTNPTSSGAVAQGHHVAVVVGAAVLGAVVLRAGGVLVDRWLARIDRAPSLPPGLPRWAAVFAAVAVVAGAAVLAGGPGFISREYNRFVNSSGVGGAQTRDRLSDPSGANRIGYWKVAVRQFSHHPLIGEGAGTYQTYYAQHRPTSEIVTDAHSLYLQTLGEDGVVGMILLGTTLLVAVGVFARRVRGPQRSLYAALFAGALAWALHSAVDWDWQMPAVTLWLFAASGLALGRGRSRKPRPVANLQRTALAASFLVLAIAPLLIGFSYQRLRAAGNAFDAGNCAQAKKRTLSSMSLLAVRPQSYEILGYCDLQQYYPTQAVAAMRKAVSYDPNDWEAHFGLALALGASGLNPMAQAREAVSLDPLEPIAHAELQEFQVSKPKQWNDVALALLIQGLQSGALSVSQL